MKRIFFVTANVAALAALTSIAISLTPSAAFAWNARGHMTVAGIAWERMTPQAKQRATALLRLNPDYGTWVLGYPAGERDRIAFMEASTWPDDLRGRVCRDNRPNPPDCIIDDGYTPPDANSDLDIGYRDRRLRAYWHFKNIPFSTDGTALEAPFVPNAETQIDFLSQSLSSSTVGGEAKSFNLTWLLHLVGDVHQPLHATGRFSATNRNGDRGGNEVFACRPAAASCDSEDDADTLHSVWDSAIGTSPLARSARTKADRILDELKDPTGFLSTVVARTSLNAPTAAWMTESFELAKKYAYQQPIGPGRGPYRLTQPYRAQAGSISEQQITVAGLRLANLLNRQLQ